jgi:uncharacterized DUF497 family protein
MIDLGQIVDFEWDEGNKDKSYQKHGITTSETEEVFLDPNQLVLDDVRHSQAEDRFIIIGKNTKKTVLLVVFTIRKNKIRVISARSANAKERRLYGKT